MCSYILISENTLYYFFSTVAQILAATTALTSIALQFKINSSQKYLIGSGYAIYERIKAKETGYNTIDEKQKNRLRDALFRESLNEIEAVLLILKDNEVKEGYSREDRPLGLQHLYEKFTRLKSDLIKSKTSIVNVTKLSFITIILSLFILTLVDFIKNNLVFEISLIFIILLMSIFSIYETYKGIKLGIE